MTENWSVGLWPRIVVAVLALVAAGAPAVVADDPRIAPLVKTGVVRVALDVANPLLAVQDLITTEYRGVTGGLANALAARIGVTLRVVAYSIPPEIMLALRDKALDAGFLAIDPTRAAVVDFSPALITVDNAYLIDPGSTIQEVGELDAAGVRIAVVSGYGPDLFLSRVLRRARVVRSTSLASALDLVIAGQADAVAGPLPSLRAQTPRLPGARLLVDRFIGESYGIAVPKGQAAWLAYVTEFVEEAKASGLVQHGIDDLALQGVHVAPPARR